MATKTKTRKTSTTGNKADDLFTKMTAQIVTAIEDGAGDWSMPWTKGALDGLARNPISGTVYRGGNQLFLWVTAILNDYPSHQWATYKQWASVGAQVRKGEQGTHCAFYRQRLIDETNPFTGEKETKRIPILNTFVVFNAAQVDGYEPAPITDGLDPAARIAEVEAFFATVGAKIVHNDHGTAAYIPDTDTITLPRFETFRDPESYYATAAHEHGHWTGHPSRLNRDLGKRFGKEAYAMEELVAELGAAFLCATLGISPVPRPDHAQYLGHWLGVLKADAKALWTVASKAQAAVDHLLVAGGLAPSPEAVE